MKLVGGRAYDVRLEYFEGIVGASVELLWQSADKDPMRRVAEVARGADIVIAAVGDGMGDETEGADRASLSLPGRQDEIVRTAAAVNPKIVVITTSGAAVAMPWLDQVRAVLHGWFPGQEAGTAFTDLLFGDVSPSGKLPVTFPKRLEDEPGFGNFPGTDGKVAYQEGILVGYRWYDTRKIAPLFPFGYGLSYTTFAYSGLKAGIDTVSFTVRNTGKRAGAEVAQVYAGLPAAADEPPKRLVAWEKVPLAPGEAKTITLKIEPKYLSIFNEQKDDWELLAGEYKIFVGGSSDNTPLTASVRR